MKRRTKIFIGAAAVVTLIGAALATPIVKLATPLFSVGNQNADIHQLGTFRNNGEEQFSAVLKTEGPSTISIQDGAYAAGGQNGWHSHPGLVIVTVISGSLQWYDENCNATTYNAGDSWVEGSQLHAFRVLGTSGIHLSAVFVTAQGQALRTDQPAPACAAGLGL
jgi:quercetin dioxygenase-like cupin family protein